MVVLIVLVVSMVTTSVSVVTYFVVGRLVLSEVLLVVNLSVAVGSAFLVVMVTTGSVLVTLVTSVVVFSWDVLGVVVIGTDAHGLVVKPLVEEVKGVVVIMTANSSSGTSARSRPLS